MAGDLELKDVKDRVVILIECIYKFNAAGGNAHIVLDDFNIEDHWLKECLEGLKINVHGDSAAQLACEKECLELLLQIPEAEREQVIREAWR